MNREGLFERSDEISGAPADHAVAMFVVVVAAVVI